MADLTPVLGIFFFLLFIFSAPSGPVPVPSFSMEIQGGLKLKDPQLREQLYGQNICIGSVTTMVNLH